MQAFVDPEQINLVLHRAFSLDQDFLTASQVRKVSTKAPFHVSSPTGDLHVAVIGKSLKVNLSKLQPSCQL